MTDERENTFTFRVDDTTECFVGWDPALETFFGQVYPVDALGERIEQDDEERDCTICWVGMSPEEIRTVDELVQFLKPHADIPADVRAKLYEIEID